LLDGVRVLHEAAIPLLEIRTPLDVVTIAHASLGNNRIDVYSSAALPDYGPTRINMVGCTFNHPGTMDVVTNRVEKQKIVFKTAGSIALHDDFNARVVPGKGKIAVDADLPGLTHS
jgi:hypothetical protein